jgi:hypothetical protein
MQSLDARSVARIAQNPCCHLQAGMLLLGRPESDVYTLLTRKPYSGPRGERTAALRWGRLCEARLTENHARRLLTALDGVIGLQAVTATIRDLRAEVPSTQPGARVERSHRTRAILSDLVAGRPVPDLVLQPPLVLSWGGRDWGTIVPDGLVLDRLQGAYLPMESKGFISLDGMVTPGERAAMRLQAAVELLALRSELARLDPESTIPLRALFVLATPYGFQPSPAVLETLEAEIAAVEGALRTLAQVLSQLATVSQTAPPQEVLHQLTAHFQEGCLTRCALAEHCRLRAPGVRGELGNHAASLVGERTDLARLIALLTGEPPVSEEEAGLLASLEETAARFSWRPS